MTNRLLTAEQIATLCATVSPGFRVLCDADSVSLPILMFRDKQVALMTADLLLSDQDFLNRFPRQMLERSSDFLCPILGTCPYWHSKCKDAGCQHVEAVEMRATTALLDQRGATHGDYRAMSTRIQQIKTIMRMGSKWTDMSEPQKEALELIATKIGRIIEGDPEFKDHWDDLGGYAAKGSEFCRKEPTSA